MDWPFTERLSKLEEERWLHMKVKILIRWLEFEQILFDIIYFPI